MWAGGLQSGGLHVSWWLTKWRLTNKVDTKQNVAELLHN